MAGQIISKVVAGGGTHLVAPSAYFVCDTAAATQAKVAKCADLDINAFVPVHGTTIAVRFVNANTYNGTVTLTLQTNSGTQILAAHNAYRYGTTNIGNSAAASWQANSIVTFTYDTVINSAGYWIMNNWNNTDENTFTSIYCGTAAATAAKVGTLSTASWSGLTGNRYLQVDMYYDNTAASALTLNIASQGAKPIYINGTASSTSNYTLPRGTYIVFYDGTNFHFRTDGKIPKLIDSGSLTTSSIGSASAGTAIPADDITAWTTNTPTAVLAKTVIRTLTSTTLTVDNGNLIIPESILTAFTAGDSVSVTAGTAASLSYTAKSIPNISVTSKTVVTGDVD